MSITRVIARRVQVVQEKVLVGTFKRNGTYTAEGQRVRRYRPNDYTSHEKGDRCVIPFVDKIPEFVTMGQFREGNIHKVPSKDLNWVSKWQDKSEGFS